MSCNKRSEEELLNVSYSILLEVKDVAKLSGQSDDFACGILKSNPTLIGFVFVGLKLNFIIL